MKKMHHFQDLNKPRMKLVHFIFYDLIQITKVCCELRVCHNPNLRPLTNGQDNIIIIYSELFKKVLQGI